MGLINYRARADRLGFDAGDLFVCGDHVADLLQSAFDSALCDRLGHLGRLDRFRCEWRLKNVNDRL